jgi:hypothetical protein
MTTASVEHHTDPLVFPPKDVAGYRFLLAGLIDELSRAGLQRPISHSAKSTNIQIHATIATPSNATYVVLKTTARIANHRKLCMGTLPDKWARNPYPAPNPNTVTRIVDI